MTHEELLAKFDDLDIAISNGFGKAETIIGCIKATRAVVELHKPIEEGGKLWCQQEDCYNHIEFLERDDCSCDYPCPTIQAIEKELGE